MADVTVRTKSNGKKEVRWRELNGRRRGRTFDRARDADRFATEIRRLQQLGGVVELDDDNTVTVAEYVEVWWRRHAIPHLAQNTRKVYAHVWDKHGLEPLGGIAIRSLRVATIEDLVADLLKRSVGAQTIRKLLTMLQSVLALAVRDDELPSVTTNVLAAVPRPRVPRRRGIVIWPTTIEAIRGAMPVRDATLVAVLAYAGLRPEEALALEWRDVTDRYVRVERAVALGEIRQDDPRKRHDRSVRLLAPLAEDLAAWRLASRPPSDRALVFPRADGTYWLDHDWRNWRKRVYQPAAKAAGLIGSRPYDLRGSFASLLIQEGRTILYVATQVGNNPETCLRHYARLFDEAPDEPISAEDAIRAARCNDCQLRLAV
jgi:integrase